MAGRPWLGAAGLRHLRDPLSDGTSTRAGRSAAERFAPLFGSRWRPVRLPNSLDLAELAALGAAGRETFDILVGRARAAAWQQARV